MNSLAHQRRSFTADGHLDENGQSLYVDALVLGRVRALPDEIRRHVEECDQCKGSIIGLYELMRQQPDAVPAEHPTLGNSTPAAPILRTNYRIAALFAIGLLGSALLYMVLPSSHPESAEHQPPVTPPELRRDSVVATPPNDLLADAFLPSPNLDELTHESFRSSAAENITPKNGDTVSFPVRFRWSPAEESMLLRIVSNKEREVFRKEGVRGNVTVTTAFRPGLYYWKLENDEGLVHIGRFFVAPVH